MSHSLVTQEIVVHDFLNVIKTSQESSTLIEIAIAPCGSSKFNRAIYFDDLSASDLENMTRRQENISFTSGLDRDSLEPLTLRAETSRKGSDKAILIKNIISFDLDFKENIEGYLPFQGSELKETLGEQLKSCLEENGVPIWMLVFSGNGFHLHFKLNDPYEIKSVQKYKEIYDSFRRYLERITGFKFDPACSNPSRLMRLPFSTNWKNPDYPKPCLILKHDSGADFSSVFRGFEATINLTGEVQKRPTANKKQLLDALNLEKILTHFHYEKTETIQTKDRRITCSSPFSQDTSPSFYYDIDKKIFYDFSSGFGGDLFTLIAKFSNLEIKQDFSKVLKLAREITGLPSLETQDTKTTIDHFKIDEKGVWHQCHSEKDATWLSSPIFVEALTRDIHSQAWGRLLVFKDQDQAAKKWSMPMELLAGDGSEIRRNLLNLGVEIAIGKRERQLFLSYLQQTTSQKRVHCVNRVGWHQNHFVLPDQVFSPLNEKSDIILQNDAKDTSFGSAGTLEDWQNNVATLCLGNSRLIFAISVSFASVLLKMTNEENGGFHFVGPSSIGKSITLKVAASTWGNPGLNGFIKRWRSTLNGLELLAAARCDSLLILDELGEVSPKEAGNAAYMLSSGIGKTRATKHTTLANQAEWRLLFLSSGEITLGEHISQSGISANAGQEVRMIDIPAENEGSYGIFENIHGYDCPGLFASLLAKNTEKNFGTAISAFLKIIMDQENISVSLNHKKTEFLSQMKNDQYHGQIHRVLRRFALVAAAGELAIEFGVLPWKKNDVRKATEKCFRDWLQSWSTHGSRESQQLLEQIKSLLQEFGPSRFPLLQDMESKKEFHHQQLWGFRKETTDDHYEWLILSETFKNIICKGHEYRRALRDLKEKKLLLVGASGQSSFSMRVPHLGVTRVVRLSGSILEDL